MFYRLLTMNKVVYYY